MEISDRWFRFARELNEEAFDIRKTSRVVNASINLRIRMVANSENKCNTPNTNVGFGVTVLGCHGASSLTCGNINGICESTNTDIAAFRGIMAQ